MVGERWPPDGRTTSRGTYADLVSISLTVALAFLVGLLTGVAGLVGFRISEADRRRWAEPGEPVLPEGLTEVLSVLRSAAIVLDAGEGVLRASPAAYAFGLVRGHELVHAELRDLAADSRRSGLVREKELELPRGPLGRARIVVQARLAPLDADHVLVLVDDRTEARRVEEVRRDFVANVSHELKTPIGSLQLLAEAVAQAADDPEAVQHFSARMEREAKRLGTLVQEIIDLSRLQVADALHEPVPVSVDAVVAEAADRARLQAENRSVELRVGGHSGAMVFGDRELLVTAVRNLMDNAASYSAEGTRVGIGVRRVDGLVEIAVKDQGIGIPRQEQERIFERFYRVDPARSRATGGTGLGLSIVKHVAANHGGEVTVWSEPGVGSTFTLRLPDSAHQVAGALPDPALADDAQSGPMPSASSAPSASSSPSVATRGAAR